MKGKQESRDKPVSAQPTQDSVRSPRSTELELPFLMGMWGVGTRERAQGLLKVRRTIGQCNSKGGVEDQSTNYALPVHVETCTEIESVYKLLP